MKSLKFVIQGMGIDINNDVKILTKAWFRYLMKTCYQWAKEHLIVSGVLIFFYLLYIFYSSVFNILFYSFPLVICLAILLGESRFNLEKHQSSPKKDHNVANTTRSICDFTSIDDDKNRRSYLQTTHMMSRRTFGRIDKKNSNNNNDDNLPNIIQEKTHIISTRVATPPSRSDSTESSQSEEDTARDQEKSKHVVEWTEYDEKNLMNLGSSEIERNKRLESLIAKRRARKMFSMQPRRHNFYSFDQHDHLDQQVMGSIIVSKGDIEFDYNGDDYHQPGSAPSVLLPTRNPFDLPYDPHEEKPVLTGGSFDEEFFFDEQHRDLLKDHFNFCNNNREISKMDEYIKDDLILPRFFTKSKVVSNNNTRLTRFKRESDAEERLNEIIEELSMQKENGHAKDQRDEESPHEVQPKSNENHDEDHQTFENPFAIYNETVGSNYFISIPKRNNKTKLAVTNNEEHITFNMETESISSCTRDNQTQPTQDHVILSDYKGQIDEDEESSTSSSSSSSSLSSSSSVNERARLDATKNEAFRNSVRKVLTCLAAFPRNNNNLLQQSNLQDILACNTNSPSNIIPSKMQERSFYTEPHHHKSNFSIASDMQVEVSEGGSPPMTANEANSPTDQDSYDGDDNKDVSSIDDEDLWGISPHPTKRGEFGMNFKLKDTLEEEEKVYNRPSNLCDVVNNVHNNENDDPSPTISMSREEEEGGSDQEARIGGVVFSLSTRSILPNEGKKKLVVDLQSTNGDILESSSSSSSEGLTSQMLGKVDHLAEYLANLPPSECGSNFLEDVERSSHVRERKTEETFHDEINQIFEFDENKEDSKEGSHRSVEDSTSTTSQIEVPKERSATSNEFHANDLINKEHVDQNSSTTEQNDYFRRIEDEGEPLEENENEVNSRPELKESISDSNSTTCQEDLLDQLRLEDNMKVTPLHQVQDHEHKDESSLSNQIIHDADESTSQEKANKDRYGIDSNSTKGTN
ncbi:probable GPI-anchored adhesin-like protein PGA55 [Chenopodium quinoa]|uniref:probable GPI-anchored adhesin-like protein PGA55 n=1 Tax=Chenopodium quinoa TaxID=63459 RepID=UPI000B772C8C|nr:probable GPI-anchored adhesin-like protein PGA55 [Chenopodium quinoa]